MSEQRDPIADAIHAEDCGCKSQVHIAEQWEYYQRLADAVRATLPRLRTEYGWACPKSADEKPCLHDGRSEAYVRFIVQKAGGAVYVHEVTDWRAES